jgi:hypothetical protein
MYRVLKSAGRLIGSALLISVPLTLAAQATPATGPSMEQGGSRWDIFAGYSYLSPKGTVDVPQPNGSVLRFAYDPVNVGGLFSGAYYFSRHLGAQVEFAEHN